jgi:hypothetical protein
MNKFPKYLVEADFAAFDEGRWDWTPTKKLWVARLRGPFVLGLVDVTPADDPAASITIALWPPVVDGDRAALADKLCRALFRHHDLYPGDWPGPKIINVIRESEGVDWNTGGAGPQGRQAKGGMELIGPPSFIHMLQPGSEREFVLNPHAPTLWRINLSRRLDATGVTWWQGFGIEPEFPRDTRRVGEFLRGLELGE